MTVGAERVALSTLTPVTYTSVNTHVSAAAVVGVAQVVLWN